MQIKLEQLNQRTHLHNNAIFQRLSELEGDGNVQQLCAPFERLKQEHEPLRDEMNRFAMDIEVIESASGGEAWRNILPELSGKADAFLNNLDQHTAPEENLLFPILANYIGRDVGSIDVMEYEHIVGNGL